MGGAKMMAFGKGMSAGAMGAAGMSGSSSSYGPAAVPINPETELLKLQSKRLLVYSIEGALVTLACCFSMCMMRPKKNKKYYAEDESEAEESSSS